MDQSLILLTPQAGAFCFADRYIRPVSRLICFARRRCAASIHPDCSCKRCLRAVLIFLTGQNFQGYLFAYCSFMEKAATVDLERALEAQRVRLLRLLTGWFGLVALMSVAPLAVPMPRWFRAFLSDVVTRAELAAHYMVQMSARLQAAEVLPDLRKDAPVASTCNPQGEVPSTASLLRRMRALRRVLKDLPLAGRRLLWRLCPKEAVVRPAWNQSSDARACSLVPNSNVPKIEPPPGTLLFGRVCF